MKKYFSLLLFFTTICTAQWQLRNNGLPGRYGHAIDAIDRNNAVISCNGVYITSDGGLNWRKISNSTVIDLVMINQTTIYAITERAVLRTTNGGTSWETVFQQLSNIGILNFIKAFQNKVIAMADADSQNSASPAQIYKSIDDGANWSQLNNNSLLGGSTWNMWRPLDFASESVGMIGYLYPTPGSQYLSYGFARTTDGGATWLNLSLPGVQPHPNIQLVKMYNESTALAYGWDFAGHANIYSTTNGGTSWDSYFFGSNYDYGDAISFIPNNPNKVFLALNYGLYYSDNGGRNWTKQSLTLAAPQNRVEDIVFVDQDCGWLITTYGDVYWTDNKGNAIVAAEKEKKLPSQYSLEQNYPNPFNPSTSIKFSIPSVETQNIASQRVTLKIYDLLGREIKTLADREMSPGNYTVTWNADDNYGKKVSTGIYLYSINAGKFAQTRKMILMK